MKKYVAVFCILLMLPVVYASANLYILADESAELDLDNDGINDISIKLNNCSDLYADLTVDFTSNNLVEEKNESKQENLENEGWADYIPKKEAAKHNYFSGKVLNSLREALYKIPYLKYIITGIIILAVIFFLVCFKDIKKGKAGSWFADLFFENSRKKRRN